MLPTGTLPPDKCIEIALWDRFGWGPVDTSSLTFKELREIFAILEQQVASKEAIDFRKYDPERNELHSTKKNIADASFKDKAIKAKS